MASGWTASVISYIADWELWGQAARQCSTADINRYCQSAFGGNWDGTRSWCGIFATHVLRLSGLQVRWGLLAGKNAGWGLVGPHQQLIPGADGITAGDVVVIKPEINPWRHYCIVVRTSGDWYVTVDGNQSHWWIIKKNYEWCKSDIWYYHRILV